MQLVPKYLVTRCLGLLMLIGLFSATFITTIKAGLGQDNLQITFNHALAEDGDVLYLSALIKSPNVKTLVTAVTIEIIVPNGTSIKVAEAVPVSAYPNDATSKRLVWSGKMPKDTKIPANSLVKVTTNLANVATKALQYQTACRWNETESIWKGEWRRRFNDLATFDAIWTTVGQKPVTAELTITRNGNQFSISKKAASDGTTCEYSGVLRGDGKTVEGTYSCKSGVVSPWTAIIGSDCN
jgi:hypothetical protein